MRCDWVFVVVGQHYRASDKCQREKRKTINGDDLLWAMATLGFEDYIEPLKVYLQKYREMEMGQQAAYNQGMGYMQPQYHNGDVSN
uniref:Transcription factor CBF/NF-Y/archaeal histone domain-containing protein n=1 Tax=Oryza rufipogon TaxID=4529 RepID=A0A0E0PNM9_ORYRU